MRHRHCVSERRSDDSADREVVAISTAIMCVSLPAVGSVGLDSERSPTAQCGEAATLQRRCENERIGKVVRQNKIEAAGSMPTARRTVSFFWETVKEHGLAFPTIAPIGLRRGSLSKIVGQTKTHARSFMRCTQRTSPFVRETIEKEL